MLKLFLAIYLLIGCFMALVASFTDKDMKRPGLAILFIILGPVTFIICFVSELVKLLTKRNGEQKFD